MVKQDKDWREVFEESMKRNDSFLKKLNIGTKKLK